MNKEVMMLKLGTAIRLVRKARGETQLSMSVKLQYKNESAYSKLESGKIKNVDLFRYFEVCQALNVCPHYVYQLANVEPPPDNNEFETYEDFLKFINSPSSS
jgi:transcriptional regulator with XRE-family HTH domain